MKTLGKTIAATVFFIALVNFVHAHPGHEGHELTWDFHGHGLWDSPITLGIGILLASAIVFRSASRQK